MNLVLWDSHGVPLSNAIEAIVVDPRVHADAHAAAAHVASTAKGGTDPIRLWKETENRFGKVPFYDHADPAKLVTMGPFDFGLREWWRDFFWHLAQTGHSPSRVILDHEDGINNWHIANAGVPGWWSSLAASEEAMRKIPTPTHDFIRSGGDWRNHRQGCIAYNEWAHRWRNAGLNTLIRTPVTACFRPHVPVTNYADNESQPYSTLDRNGWPIPHGSVAGSDSPVLYLDHKPTGSTRPTLLSAERMTRVTKTAARAAPWSVPWVAAPGYGALGPNTWGGHLDRERDVTAHLLRSLGERGVGAVIVWNPSIDPNAKGNAAWLDSLSF